MTFLSSLLGLAPGDPWAFVEPRFNALFAGLDLTPAQIQDGWTKQAGVRRSLNRHYYGVDDPVANSFLTGSWGKELAVRPGRDIDLMFVLPDGVLRRFDQRMGNQQSQLLQEVKSVLSATYGVQTEMRGDQQAVVVRFATIPVDVVPVFQARYGQFRICDTRNAGAYRLADPFTELQILDASDRRHLGMTRLLIRAIKQWQRHCNVGLRSFQIERLVIEFISIWRGAFYYPDWLVRDFFSWLARRSHTGVVMPGTLEVVSLGEGWRSRVLTAAKDTAQACDFERDGQNLKAGEAWQRVFGQMIPLAA